MPPPTRAAARFGITYREMDEVADLDFVAALYAETRQEELAPVPWTGEQKAAFLAQQHAAQHAHYRAHYPGAEWLIIERKGIPVGRLYLSAGRQEVRIVDIAIVAAARGQGIGGAILVDLSEQADADGRSLSIHVEKNNPARRLYERLGFAVAADRGVYDFLVRPCGGGAAESA
jgi:ribosomal protein S18 acetylase RimI-like enzyme